MNNADAALKLELATSEHGFHDYDVVGHQTLRRACVPLDILKGDLFNVYHGETSKSGAKWLATAEFVKNTRGDVKTRLSNPHRGQEQLVPRRTGLRQKLATTAVAAPTGLEHLRIRGEWVTSRPPGVWTSTERALLTCNALPLRSSGDLR